MKTLDSYGIQPEDILASEDNVQVDETTDNAAVNQPTENATEILIDTSDPMISCTDPPTTTGCVDNKQPQKVLAGSKNSSNNNINNNNVNGFSTVDRGQTTKIMTSSAATVGGHTSPKTFNLRVTTHAPNENRMEEIV